jgi:hypothetical protein
MNADDVIKPPAKIAAKVVSAAMLVQLAPDSYVQMNFALSPGRPPAAQATVVGRAPSPDQLRQVAATLLELFRQFEGADLEPRMIVTLS